MNRRKYSAGIFPTHRWTGIFATNCAIQDATDLALMSINAR
jgi:hypothetical protein